VNAPPRCSQGRLTLAHCLNRNREQNGSYQRLEEGNGELAFDGDRVSVLQEQKEFWRWMVRMVAQPCDCH